MKPRPSFEVAQPYPLFEGTGDAFDLHSWCRTGQIGQDIHDRALPHRIAHGIHMERGKTVAATVVATVVATGSSGTKQSQRRRLGRGRKPKQSDSSGLGLPQIFTVSRRAPKQLKQVGRGGLAMGSMGFVGHHGNPKPRHCSTMEMCFHVFQINRSKFLQRRDDHRLLHGGRLLQVVAQNALQIGPVGGAMKLYGVGHVVVGREKLFDHSTEL